MRRREFIRTLTASGAVMIGGPTLLGCASGGSKQTKQETAPAAEPAAAPARRAPVDSFEVPPTARPADWDPIDYNRRRGDAGFIPKEYMAQIHNPDGVGKHLGKHLPWVARPAGQALPAGVLPLAWGDPKLGYAKHPNAPRTDAKPEGHWYNWIRVAAEGDPRSEVTTTFDDWPNPTTAAIVGLEGDDPAADGGRNAVYLATLPAGVKTGDWVRVWAHCLTHGEYVDFVQVG
jgi:hypothetical protein